MSSTGIGNHMKQGQRLAVNTGAADDATMRVILASDSPGGNDALLTAILAALTAELTVAFDPDALTTPTSVLTRPSDTNPYVQNDLLASSTTAGSIVVPSITAVRADGGSSAVRKLRLYTNKITSGMATAQFRVELWSAAPTFTNGDNGAYAVATGAASWLAAFESNVMTQVGDGAYCALSPVVGSEVGFNLVSGTLVYWSLKEIDLTGFTPASGQTFTLVPEVWQN